MCGAYTYVLVFVCLCMNIWYMCMIMWLCMCHRPFLPTSRGIQKCREDLVQVVSLVAQLFKVHPTINVFMNMCVSIIFSSVCLGLYVSMKCLFISMLLSMSQCCIYFYILIYLFIGVCVCCVLVFEFISVHFYLKWECNISY